MFCLKHVHNYYYFEFSEKHYPVLWEWCFNQKSIQGSCRAVAAAETTKSDLYRRQHFLIKST